ncbi:protoporphyrinogen oxidase [Alicyclobacillus acidiphilus]|uniref:protoporphyrinogen oxidase n=1 Tax=Alicyclobacillus acidiphilus TaxID=182455 RepID=UPI0008326F3D|nr:protoporphyrinogen oxidase [Alicyclobacillus acidiphilus]
MPNTRVAIIGGGITGLSAAKRLIDETKASGERPAITLYEADKRLGGKIRTYREGGFTLEAGPDSMLARKPSGMRLLRELGMESDIVYMNSAASRTFIVRNRRLEPMPLGSFMGLPGALQPFLRNTVLSSSGKLRALFDLVLPPSDLSHDVSLGHFLRERLGDEWTNYLGEPMLAGIYAGEIDNLSLFATWGQFAELARKHRSLILGARDAKRRQETNATGLSGRSAFVTVRGGLESVIERLATFVGPYTEFRMGSAVERIRQTPGGFEIVSRTGADTERAIYDSVILAVPVKQLNSLLGDIAGSASLTLDVPYNSTATIALNYRSEDVHVDLSQASGFLVPRDEGIAMTASTWLSSKWPHTTPAGNIVLRCYVGRAGQDTYLSLDDEELADVVAKEVTEIVGIQARPTFHKVTRWNESMPNYRIGHLHRVAAFRQSLQAQAPGVAVAGAGLDGLGLPDCIIQGERAADEALAYVRSKRIRDKAAGQP